MIEEQVRGGSENIDWEGRGIVPGKKGEKEIGNRSEHLHSFRPHSGRRNIREKCEEFGKWAACEVKLYCSGGKGNYLLNQQGKERDSKKGGGG